MKRLFFALFLTLFFISPSFADIDQFEGENITPDDVIEGCTSCDQIEGQDVASGGGPSPDWQSNWNGVDPDDETCSSTPCPDTWDSVTNDSTISVVSDELATDLGTVGTDSYVSYDGNFAYSEYTIKFTVKLDYLTGVLSGNDPLYPIFIKNNQPDHAVRMFFYGLSGDLSHISSGAYNDDDSESSLSTISMTSGFSANTEYPIEIYVKCATTDSSNDGVFSVAIRNDSSVWLNQSRSDLDNNVEGVLDQYQFGAVDNEWGDGTNDATMKQTYFKLYHSDQRSSY